MLANLNENFRQCIRGNTEFTHLKIICIFVKYSLLATMQKDVSKSAATPTGFPTSDKHQD